MIVSELTYGLWFGDILENRDGERFVVIWVRQDEKDGSPQNDNDIQLMNNEGGLITIKDVSSLQNWKYVKNSFE